MEYVSYEEFKKMDMRVGTIREVVPVEGTDKLLRFQIDFNEVVTGAPTDPQMIQAQAREELLEAEATEGVGQVKKLRQIVSGIHEFYPDYESLVGKQVLYIVNLEPRLIRGVESNGMLMAVDGVDGKPVFLTPEVAVAPGAHVR